MRFFGLLCAFLVGVTTAGCFSVDVAGLTFKCDPTQSGQCPDGEVCSATGKVCVPTADGSAATTDMGTGPGAPPLVMTPACPGGMGYNLSKPMGMMAFACPTTFSNMPGKTADAQCMGGFMLCGNGDSVDLNKCGQLSSGFFIVNAPAHKGSQGTYCSGTSATMDLLWSGCGGRQSNSVMCMNFDEAIQCGNQGFTCYGGMIGDVVNQDPNNGILCCK